ncbi:hypothetical protein AB0M02_03630 [Actinoplanes sp. NPDC051861]|uniref:hypothetical protein n=1 Tax=Actinoplanes sp. NPDC051861 TaxID=3155170 RepID=UPI0034284B6E
MSKNRIITIAAAALMGLVTTLAGPVTAASADDLPVPPAFEYNTAVAGTPPAGLPNSSCIVHPGATVCFVADGDRWWVRDTAADSASAAAYWQNVVNSKTARSGRCLNSLGNGTWGYCSKNYVEASILLTEARVFDASEGVTLSRSAPKTYFP